MDAQVQLRDLREKYASASEGMAKIIADGENEDRSLNEGEQERYDGLSSEIDSLTPRIDRLERQLKVNAYSPTLNDDIGVPEKDMRQFSLTRLVHSLANSGDMRAFEAASFEREVSQAIAEKRQAPARGAYVPSSLWQKRAVHTVGTDNVGGHLVEDVLRDDEFIGLLRASSVVAAGATQMPGLVGNQFLPKQLTGVTHTWLANETTDATESNSTYGQVTLAPKQLAIHSRWSRLAGIQTTPAIETLARNDMLAKAAQAIDNAALYGSGSSGQPTGVLNVSGLNKPTAFAAATPTWAELMTLVGLVAADNAVGIGGQEDGRGPGGLSWVINGPMMANLMAAVKDAGSGQFIMGEAGTIGPWNVGITNNITDGDIWFGAFSEIMIGTWGDPDLIVNPFTNDLAGITRLTMHQAVDVAVRHAEALGYNNDT